VILPQRGLLVPEIDVKKQLKLLRTCREVERLVRRSAAKSATPGERALFARLAAGFEKAASANDDLNFVRLDREFNELCGTAAQVDRSRGLWTTSRPSPARRSRSFDPLTSQSR
jgi:DNA-binding GntR family transcriptional regulator